MKFSNSFEINVHFFHVWGEFKIFSIMLFFLWILNMKRSNLIFRSWPSQSFFHIQNNMLIDCLQQNMWLDLSLFEFEFFERNNLLKLSYNEKKYLGGWIRFNWVLWFYSCIKYCIILLLGIISSLTMVVISKSCKIWKFFNILEIYHVWIFEFELVQVWVWAVPMEKSDLNCSNMNSQYWGIIFINF